MICVTLSYIEVHIFLSGVSFKVLWRITTAELFNMKPWSLMVAVRLR